ncbi:MAG: dTDP-4-dehydrorhamnose reductase [Candidatus Omnitrophica bacterium]|nr:dTDP-4-dehydrorhamnose reductase [Candidatus Omnitrophota bacterium]
MRNPNRRVLVTGAAGMLGTALCSSLTRKEFHVLKTDIRSGEKEIELLDVSNYEEVQQFVQETKPHLTMHLAAETDVDKCQLEVDHAYRVNTLGTENVALACQRWDIPLVYISTGAVFDGEKPEPYTEFDEPNPVNVYAKTKWEGEKIVQTLVRKHFIVRAGWMIGGGRKDKKFVAKIVELLQTQKEIPVVTDKFGNPTFTKDLSENLLLLIQTGRFGLYHMVNRGGCSRYQIAQKIAECMGKKDVVLRPVTSEAFPLPAPRGRSEMLLNYRLSLLGLDRMRPWTEALKDYLSTLQQEEIVVH